LAVDGKGRLYVFLVSFGAANKTPVDVYDSHGNRIIAGLTEHRGWMEAKGDYVYVIEDDPDTAAQVVARYRLVLPSSR